MTLPRLSAAAIAVLAVFSAGSPVSGQLLATEFDAQHLARPFGFQTVPFDMNASGESVGYYLDASLNYRAIVWDVDGNPSDLAAAGSWSQAHGISDSGLVSGYYGPTLQSTQPAVWGPEGVTLLSLLGGYAGGVARDVASDGSAVGYATGLLGTEIFFWDGAIPIAPSGTSRGGVDQVLDTGESVGNVLVSGFPRAAHWDAGGMLSILPGIAGGESTSAVALSSDGRILGAAAESPGVGRLVVWDSPGAEPLVLERFEGVVGVARAINALGWVVGADNPDPYNGTARALAWDASGTPVDLNDLIPPDSGWTLLDAVAVNDAGEILVFGTRSGLTGQHAAKLIPAPEPGRLLLLGTGVIALLALRRNRS